MGKTKIELGATEFEIEGKRFYKDEDMSVPRYEYFDRLWPMYVFGMTFQQLIASIDKAENVLLNSATVQLSIMETATMLRNMKVNLPSPTTASQIEVAMEICALIFNEKGEDDLSTSDTIINPKKELFRKCNASFFLISAAELIPGLLAHWRKFPEIMESLNKLSMEELSLMNDTFGQPTKPTENLDLPENNFDHSDTN